MEFPAGEFTGRFAADMDRKRRGRGVKELFGVVVGKNNPEIGIKCTQPAADIGSHFTHMRNDRLVLRLRHCEELRRVRQHGAADYR
jgi:hypothetical protein